LTFKENRANHRPISFKVPNALHRGEFVFHRVGKTSDLAEKRSRERNPKNFKGNQTAVCLISFKVHIAVLSFDDVPATPLSPVFSACRP
jgi:hypothetical protein